MRLSFKIASNTFYQLVGRLVGTFTVLISTALITRALGAETFGEYAIVMTYSGLFYVISDFGINAIVTRDFAKSEETAQKNYTKVLGFRIFVGLLISLVAVVILQFLPYSDAVKAAILVSIPLIFFNSVSKAASVIFQSYLRYKYLMISQVIGSLVSLALVWFAISKYETESVAVLIALYTIGTALAASIAVFYTRNYIHLKHKWIDINYWKYLILDALPLGISLVLNAFMIQADRLLLTVLSVPVSVGIYTIAYRIFELVLVVPTFFMNAMYPVLIRKKDESKEQYVLAVNYTLLVMLLMSILAAIATILLAPVLVPKVWGEEMKAVVAPLNVLMIGSFVFFLTSPFSWILLIEGKQKVLPYIYGAGLVVNLILNVIFIPKYDYMAAAYTTILTEFMILVVLYSITRKLVYINPLICLYPQKFNYKISKK